MSPFIPLLLVVAAGPLALGQWLTLGILLIGLLTLALAFWQQRRRQELLNRQYPPAYRGTAILMHEHPTGMVSPEGLPVRELHLAVEVPAHAPRYPVVLQMPIALVYEHLLVPGVRLPAYVDPQNRQRLELDWRTARARKWNRKG